MPFWILFALRCLGVAFGERSETPPHGVNQYPLLSHTPVLARDHPSLKTQFCLLPRDFRAGQSGIERRDSGRAQGHWSVL